VQLKDNYCLKLQKSNKNLKLAIKANDASHAQAQALDICRSLSADQLTLLYEEHKNTKLSELFKKLAYSDFNHKECFEWSSSYTNGCPAIYLFGKRFYIRPLILDYMDMNRDNFVKMTCKNKRCVNPYHFSYAPAKASKLTGGDKKLMLAFASQGVSVQQIAEALKVHRTTVYRNLNNERLSSGT
jgi:Transposase and inactivated derivatives, IS30 family